MLAFIITIIILVVVFWEQLSLLNAYLLEWIEDNKVLGPAMMSLIFIISTVCFIPVATILTLGAGWAFQ